MAEGIADARGRPRGRDRARGRRPIRRAGRPAERRARLERDLATAEREAFLADPELAAAFERETAAFTAAAERIADAHDGARIVAQITEQEEAHGPRLGRMGAGLVSLALLVPSAVALGVVVVVAIERTASEWPLWAAAALTGIAGGTALVAAVAVGRGRRALGAPRWAAWAAAVLLAAVAAASVQIAIEGGWLRAAPCLAAAALACLAVVVFAVMDRVTASRCRRLLEEETAELRQARDALDRALAEARHAATQGLAVDGDGTALRAVVEERRRRLDALLAAGRLTSAERAKLESVAPGAICLGELLGEVLGDGRAGGSGR
ncbi:hypothetical protein [Agromyces archimandritae]|uniref:Uncharacterized protein n=1 Tax=Agromyces archimandritae TaxID=2781962 RepID=A0A975FNQ7_9MICO|nr:hypothetical protein [Agromyces archimandritae]QTX05499.1 hypothetical protein G127AT_04590 [Agromyces archimandritae]